MYQKTQARVVSVIGRSLSIPESSVRLDQTIKDLCPQSLDLVNLLFEFEDEFSISISNEEAEAMNTVQDIVTAVDKLLAEAKTTDTADHA